MERELELEQMEAPARGLRMTYEESLAWAGEVKRPQMAGAMGYWFRGDRQASSASQFYLLQADVPDLETDFTAFSTITAGLEVVGKLTMDDKIVTIAYRREVMLSS